MVTEEKLTAQAHQFVCALSTAEDSKTTKSKEAKTKTEAPKTKTESEETKSEEMTLEEAEAVLSKAEELVKEATSKDEEAQYKSKPKLGVLKKYSEDWEAEMKIVYESEGSKKYVYRCMALIVTLSLRIMSRSTSRVAGWWEEE